MAQTPGPVTSGPVTSGPVASGVVEPVPPGLARLLRAAVLEHARSERRLVHPPLLHGGVPGLVTEAVDVTPEPCLDAALRVDLVEALVRRVRRPGPAPLLWLTRCGGLSVVEDGDLAWAAAVSAAAAELTGRPVLPFVVVVRDAWQDPRSGVGRSWRRLRGPRRPA